MNDSEVRIIRTSENRIRKDIAGGDQGSHFHLGSSFGRPVGMMFERESLERSFNDLRISLRVDLKVLVQRPSDRSTVRDV